MIGRRLARLVLSCVLAGLAAGGGPPALAAPDWPQWGGDPEHQGRSAAVGQPPAALLADVVYDPFVAREKAETQGDLLAHYAVPLLEGSNVYVESKSGSYISCDPPGSGEPAPCGPDAWGLQTWNVKKLVWQNGALAEAWTFASDWKPEPNGEGLSNWEPVFHSVLAGDFLYVPGFGATVFQLAKTTGRVVARINPFGRDLDPAAFVAGGLAADASGNVYYNAIRLNSTAPWTSDALGAWLVRVAPDGSASRVAFSALVPAAPDAFAPCQTSFDSDLPWPPSAGAIAPTVSCGSQRPGINTIPAIAADGTVYTVSRAHRNGRYGYLVAVHPDLTPFWSASLRGILRDGCGVRLPPNGAPGGCRQGATPGLDPATNDLPAGRVSDLASSSPVVLPDGAILYGALTTYNYARGHLFKFGPDGRALATYDFGWDITPAVWPHDGTYSVLVKDNHYEIGSYCGDKDFCPPEVPHYDITSLDPNLSVEWSFTSTNTLSCERSPGGGIECVSDHPDGFEWCVNQPAVDASGVTYASSEDGFLYAIGPGGLPFGKIFLDVAVGAAYTPVSISSDGILYVPNNGHVFAVGVPSRASPAPISGRRSPRAVRAR
jgi:hypothetical protein